MSRAEYRRAFKKQASSRKTFVMTREELDKIRMQEFERAKKLLTKTNEQMAEDIIRMMLVIPTNVLIADHWEKSAKRRIPKFVEDCISLYQAWEQGAVSMDEMQKLTEEYSGIKLVDSKTPTGRVLKERKRKEDAGRSSKSTKIRKPDVVEEPKPEEQIEGQMSVEDFQEVLPEKKDVEIRKPTEEEKEVLNSLARKLIRDKYDYFLQDYQNRVAHVIKAEEELKKHISIDRRTGIYFISGMNTYYVNLFEDYIQLWGMEFIGKFEWFYLISWNNGLVHECIFAFPHVFQRKRYIHLQKHMLENGAYVIENAILENQSGSQEGKELTHEEWSQLRPFKDLVERVETGSSEPQFVIDRLNLANNADEDETNPMGIAIFANALDILKKIDLEFDSYSNEFELGRKRIFVAPELMKNENGSPTFDAESGIFYLLPEDYDTRQEGLIKEVNMEIRSEDHRKAINDDLNLLSMKCGFGTEHYKFDGSGVKTATEVISENSDMYRMIKKHEIVLDRVLKQLVRTIIRLGIVAGNPLDASSEIVVDFDDSIIEDKQAERKQDMQDVSIGAMPMWEYRMKWYNEDEATAKSRVNTPAEVIE